MHGQEVPRMIDLSYEILLLFIARGDLAACARCNNNI